MIRKGRRAIKCIHFIREEKVSQREGKWDKCSKHQQQQLSRNWVRYNRGW
jgi:hypothetical protein